MKMCVYNIRGELEHDECIYIRIKFISFLLLLIFNFIIPSEFYSFSTLSTLLYIYILFFSPTISCV